jgi:hypothetical protein
MNSHIPFEYLKHKLWPKKRWGVNLSIWLPNTKSQELLWLTCVQVVCHISLEISQQGLQFFFRPHLNKRCAQKVMSLQSRGSPNFKNFKTSNLGVPRQNDICVQLLWLSTKNIIRGKVVASPKFGLWRVLWVHVCPW